MNKNGNFPLEAVASRIFVIRKQRVMIDADLSSLYGLLTKALNQAVKRNINRFPSDFMFQLSVQEKEELVTKCDRFKRLKHSTSLPYAFTEQGVSMLSSVVNSEKAIEVNILIIRTFVKLRNLLASHEDLRRKIAELEGRQNKTEEDVQMLISAVNMLLDPPPEKPKKRFGFIREE